MLTAKSIVKIMRMKASLGIPANEGSCFGVTDASRTRDAIWDRSRPNREVKSVVEEAQPDQKEEE